MFLSSTVVSVGIVQLLAIKHEMFVRLNLELQKPRQRYCYYVYWKSQVS